MNRMCSKQLVAYFILTLLMCGCSQQEPLTLSEANRCKVRFSSAYLEVTKSTSFVPQGIGAINVSAYEVQSGGEATSCFQTKLYNIADDIGTLSPKDGTEMYTTSTSNYVFYAYSPALSFKAGETKKVSIPNGTDFMVTKSDATTLQYGVNNVTLPAMTRMCACLEVKVLYRVGTHLQGLTIANGGLTVSKLTHSPLDYVLGTDAISTSGATTDASIVIPAESFVTSGATYVAATAVLPKKAAALDMSLNITQSSILVSGQSASQTTKLVTASLPSIAFQAGYKYAYTLEFSDEAKVNAWLVVSSTNTMGQMVSTSPIKVGEWNAGGFVVNPNWSTEMGKASSSLPIKTTDWGTQTNTNAMGQ